jgi:hypothetical protein
MFAANLGPGLSRRLAFAAQSFDHGQRMEMYHAFDDISTVVGSDDDPVHDLDDSRVPEKARATLESLLIEVGFEIKGGMIQ